MNSEYWILNAFKHIKKKIDEKSDRFYTTECPTDKWIIESIRLNMVTQNHTSIDECNKRMWRFLQNRVTGYQSRTVRINTVKVVEHIGANRIKITHKLGA